MEPHHPVQAVIVLFIVILVIALVARIVLVVIMVAAAMVFAALIVVMAYRVAFGFWPPKLVAFADTFCKKVFGEHE